jgi:hypothetical protein
LAFEKPAQHANVRVAAAGGNIYLDLADDVGRCVEVRPDGWQVLGESPVPFYRPISTRPLPVPDEGGSIDDLAHFVNVVPDELPIIMAYLMAVLDPSVPCPILIQIGSAGTAKSTNSRILKRLIDPSVGAGGSVPTNERELIITAANDMLLFFDNVSNLNGNSSDMLCRMSTGGGYRTRKLYTVDDLALFEVRRPVMITAVHNPVCRTDLASRCLIIEPPAIPKGGRRPEREIYREFEAKHPLILGAMLTLLAKTLAADQNVSLDDDYRMADFAVHAARVEAAAGWPKGSLTQGLRSNASCMREDMMESNVVASAIVNMAEMLGTWTGTADQLDNALRNVVRLERHRELPSNLANLARQVMEIAPLLGDRGISITKARTGRARLITIEKVGNPEDQVGPSGDSAPTEQPPDDAVTPMTLTQ